MCVPKSIAISDVHRMITGYGISIDVANCIITGGNVDDIEDAVRVGRRRHLCALAEYWPKALALATNMRKIAHVNELRTPLINSRHRMVSVLAPLSSPGHVQLEQIQATQEMEHPGGVRSLRKFEPSTLGSMQP